MKDRHKLNQPTANNNSCSDFFLSTLQIPLGATGREWTSGCD